MLHLYSIEKWEPLFCWYLHYASSLLKFQSYNLSVSLNASIKSCVSDYPLVDCFQDLAEKVAANSTIAAVLNIDPHEAKRWNILYSIFFKRTSCKISVIWWICMYHFHFHYSSVIKFWLNKHRIYHIIMQCEYAYFFLSVYKK